MEIQLKVPLVEDFYSKLSTFVRYLWPALFLTACATAFWWGRFGAICFVLCYPLAIAGSYFKNYKIIGEIILGYHHITADGNRFLIKDMENINVFIQREPKFSKSPVILSGTRNFVSFYLHDNKHSYRMLLNNKDIEAVDFLVNVWQETYRLKVGHKV